MDSFNSQNFMNDLFWYTNAERLPAPLVNLFNRPNFKDFLTDLNNQTRALKSSPGSPNQNSGMALAENARPVSVQKKLEASVGSSEPNGSLGRAPLRQPAFFQPTAAPKAPVTDFYGGLETAVQSSPQGLPLQPDLSVLSAKDTQPRNSTSDQLSKQPPLPLYSTLLGELLTVSRLIDQCDTAYRDYVWSVVFEVVGVAHKSDKPFYPIILSWLDSPTVNLVAIELLYTSFSIALQQRPLPISRAKMSRALEESENEFPTSKKQKILEESHATQAAPPAKDLSSIPSFGVPTAKLVEEMREHFRSLPEDLTPTRGSGLLSKAFGRSYSPPEQSRKQSEISELKLNVVPTSEQSPKSSPRGEAQPLCELPKTEALKAGLAECNFTSITFVQLIDMVKHLQLVSVHLDGQPVSIQNLIWEACKISPAFQETTPLEPSSFQKLLQQWSSNLGVHKSNVIILYSVVEYFRNVGLIKSECPKTEEHTTLLHNSQPVSSKRSNPENERENLSRPEHSQRRPRIMDVSSLVCE